MRILSFTTLYPNAAQPNHGVFVEQRLHHLAATGEVEVRVVAPIPWFPSRHPIFGRYARYASVPRLEIRHGLEIRHPRYPLIPKIGMVAAPYLLSWVKPSLQRLREEGFNFDLIDAHYFYPDGVAAAMLGRALGRRVVITARGTDINMIPRYRWPRRLICWAADQAVAIIVVCQALKDALQDLGVPGSKITVLRNGVDTRLFHPVDRMTERARLGLSGVVLLSVGLLIERKGHDLVIRALRELSDTTLLIAGEGEEERNLKALARSIGVEDRVRFLGAVPQPDLKRYYSAADALVLASSREGWANVLLESMACGTPVVATSIWGTPEVVAAPEAGVLVVERSPAALAAAVRRLLDRYPDREATRRYTERFGWEETTQGQIALFRGVLEDKGHV